MGFYADQRERVKKRKSPSVGDKKERLTLGLDFILSRSISGTARLSYGQPGSPGFTSRSGIIIARCSGVQPLIHKKWSGSPWALISFGPVPFQKVVTLHLHSLSPQTAHPMPRNAFCRSGLYRPRCCVTARNHAYPWFRVPGRGFDLPL